MTASASTILRFSTFSLRAMKPGWPCSAISPIQTTWPVLGSEARRAVAPRLVMVAQAASPTSVETLFSE